MRKINCSWPGVTLLALMGVVACAFATIVSAGPTTKPSSAGDADAVLAQIEQLQPPKFDSTKQQDQEYVKSYIESRRKWAAEKAELEGTFVAAYPDHAKTPAMRLERWRLLASSGQDAKAQGECEQYLSEHADDADALYFLATTTQDGADRAKAEAAVDRFIKAHPKDERGAGLLSRMTMMDGVSDDQRKEILNRLVKDYPDSRVTGYAKGQLRRADAIGKPFDLSFTDTISGKPIAMNDLKGKVVVVDFWATWCGPCVAEMPTMKKLYAEYKPKGVEFIGISLDNPEANGGLSKLKEFVAKNEIAWPQYYQGKGWESEFSTSWGVNSIPCVFIVDADGNLASGDARGKLEDLLPKLIAKRDGKSADARN